VVIGLHDLALNGLPTSLSVPRARGVNRHRAPSRTAAGEFLALKSLFETNQTDWSIAQKERR
jgi:hypothetical protein